MTLAKMSSEGDSAKIAQMDTNEKINDMTDSSQDSADLKADNDVKEAKPAENDIEMKDDKPDPTTEEESMDSENASVTSEKKEEPEEEKPEDKGDSQEEKDDAKEADTEPKKEESATNKKEESVKNGTEDKKDNESVEEDDGEEKEQNGDEDAEEEEEDVEEEEEEEEKEEIEEKKEEVKKKPAARGRQKKAETEAVNKKEKKDKEAVKAKEAEEDEEDDKEEEESEDEEEEPKEVIFLDGGGIPLGTLARVEASITRFKNEDLKTLHTLLFRMVGKVTMLKKNIKRFNGFTFKKNSDKYKKKVAFLNNLELKELKVICDQLDLQKMGAKDELVNRVMDFLLEPKEMGRNATPVSGGDKGVGGRPKRASAVRANNRGYSSHDDYSSDAELRASRAKGKRPNLKDETTSDEEFKPGGEDYDSDEKPKVVRGAAGGGGRGRKRGRPKKASSEEEASASESEASDFDDEPKSKKKRSPAKVNNKAKKTPAKGRGRAARGSPAKKAPGRGKKAKDSSESEDDEVSSSEDEPLVKKSKGKRSGPPTDDEIKKFIKKLLEGANLEEITMKTVCQKVYDNYPDFDLTNKKYFIKSTVKSLIST